MSFYLHGLTLIFVSALMALPLRANDIAPSLRIGLLVTLSGPARSWGEVNVACARIGAQLVNENGGVIWQGKAHQLELIIEDDALDPAQAVAAAKRLIDKKVLWVIGSNVADTTRVVQPLFEAAAIPHITYGFSRDLFGPRHPFTLLGMASNYQLSPTLFDLLRNRLHVQRLSMVVHESEEGRTQAVSDSATASTLGMELIYTDPHLRRFASYRSYEGRDGRRAAESIQRLRPDAVLLAGATPDSAPRIVRFLRDVNYAGLIVVTTAIDEAHWRNAERESEGVISISNHWQSAQQSNYFREFRRRYIAEYTAWHNEATTKAYALETIVQFLKLAETQRIYDPNKWPQLLSQFSALDPFVSHERSLRLQGESSLGLARLLAVPTVIAQLRRGHYRPITTVDLLP